MNTLVLVRSALVILAALVCLVQASPTRAQPQPAASHLAVAKELVDVVGAARQFDSIVSAVIVQVASNFLQANGAYGKDLNDIVDLLVTEYLPRRVEVQNDVIRLYASRLAEQEMKDVLTFYKSPVGKKMLTESQFVLNESLTRAENWAGKFREEVAPRVRAELKKRGHKL
jgi:uncharacterized protein